MYGNGVDGNQKEIKFQSNTSINSKGEAPLNAFYLHASAALLMISRTTADDQRARLCLA